MEDAGVEHEGAQPDARHVGGGHQRRERRGQAQVVGHPPGTRNSRYGCLLTW
jgi:hypothetical protein